MSWFTSLLGGWKIYALVLAVGVGLGGGIGYKTTQLVYQNRVDSVQHLYDEYKLQVLQDANSVSQLTFERLAERAKTLEQLLGQNLEQDKLRLQSSNNLLKELQAREDSNETVCAPIGAYLDGVQRLQSDH